MSDGTQWTGRQPYSPVSRRIAAAEPRRIPRRGAAPSRQPSSQYKETTPDMTWSHPRSISAGSMTDTALWHTGAADVYSDYGKEGGCHVDVSCQWHLSHGWLPRPPVDLTPRMLGQPNGCDASIGHRSSMPDGNSSRFPHRDWSRRSVRMWEATNAWVC